jgi:hypothetical protein
MSVIVVCTALVACSRSLDFSPLANADRIDVRTSADHPIKEITDAQQVAAAMAFIMKNADGWREHPSGPVVPDLMLYFYRGSSRLGGFGISRDHIVADPTVYGWLSRSISAEQRDTLLKALGLSLPTASR